jgi:DNA-binding response OmpR family regulator
MVEKPRILIVEDDLDLSEMVSSYFRVQNYEVLTAAWGEEALNLANNHELDLVMLDIRLPDIDGFELCRRLRSNRRTQDTPIVFLTEKRDRIDKLQGLELGVVDYITKPFDIQELRLRVRNAINRAKMPAATNPVTDLPEGELVDEKLGVLLNSSEWAVLEVSIDNLGTFRERYGFVAADDVMRAVTLMVRNAVREFGEESDFIGHLSQENFIIITKPDVVEEIQDRIERRIAQSREYFFPLKDRVRAKEAMDENNLKIASGTITHNDAPFADLDALKTKLRTAVEEVK